MEGENRQNCACHVSHSAMRSGDGDPNRSRWSMEEGTNWILSPVTEAQLFGVKDRCFRLGWEGEKNDHLVKAGGTFRRKRMYDGRCGSHFNDSGKKVNFKRCPKFCSHLGMRIPGQGL